MAYLKLTVQQTELHATALRLSREYRELEARLCECLREIDETKLFKKLGWPSLFIYATRELGLTEAVAYAFISVARKSREIPQLKAAIEEKTLSVAKASRMVSGLNLENAGELIDFAKTRSTRELEAELARRNPESRRRDQVRFVDGDSVELRTYLPKSVNLKLERVMALLAQKRKPTNLAAAIESVLDEYLKHHDPVEKAKRAEMRAVRRLQVPTHDVAHQDMHAEEQAVSQHEAFRYEVNREAEHGEKQTTPTKCQTSGDDFDKKVKCAKERVANKRSLSRYAPVQDQKSRLGQESKPGSSPAQSQEPIRGQGSPRENNPRPRPSPGPKHESDLNNKYLLRTRRVCAEAQGQRPVPKQGPTPNHKPASLRRPLSASEKHAVFLRDEGRCTFVNERGERCSNDRYLHVHHIKMVSQGGTNELSNTIVLCSVHHDLVHQLSFPIDGQVNWLRER
jgi:hypothetical protein